MRTPCLPIFALLLLPTWAVGGQGAAPSSHMVFDDDFPGDIIINEVRVPKVGEAMYTYYETLGWRGNGAGYAGIQFHPEAHLFLFSIWDHKSHTAPIRAVYRGAGTKTVGFGGEGTGLKSWNFDLGWSPGVWYTLVARTWPVKNHTFYGFWVRAGDTGKWTHLVTMDVAAKANFEGRTDAFIEDWLETGAKPRTTQLRGGWKRKLDGDWFPFGEARYSVNSWDLEAGKRSYQYRTNWDGGVQRDKTGSFYYMISGGPQTKPTATNPARFRIRRQEKEPNFAKLKVRNVALTRNSDGDWQVRWQVDDTTTPPFSLQLQVFDNKECAGEPITTQCVPEPHARAATLNPQVLSPPEKNYYLRLRVNDILDRESEPVIRQIPAGNR